MSDGARLEIDGKTYEFPMTTGSEGERAIDIGQLRSETGAITLDPGYKNSGSCESTITFIDGESGILRHRGYSIVSGPPSACAITAFEPRPPTWAGFGGSSSSTM